MVEVEEQEDIIHIPEVAMILCLCDSRPKCAFSPYCRKSSVIRPDEGEPIPRPSCWDIISCLWVK